ncbi:MAG: hypothetical protein JNL72_15035 [Flavipsychrobacter sp.]|nr:hypothetical protein [Flavipsychrobacter sp.]
MRQIARFVLLLLSLMLMAHAASANHGVDAIGSAIVVILAFSALALVLSFISWAIAFSNRKRYSKTKTVVAILLALPMLAMGLLILPLFPAVGLGAVAIFLVSGWLIYSSTGTRHA